MRYDDGDTQPLAFVGGEKPCEWQQELLIFLLA